VAAFPTVVAFIVSSSFFLFHSIFSSRSLGSIELHGGWVREHRFEVVRVSGLVVSVVLRFIWGSKCSEVEPLVVESDGYICEVDHGFGSGVQLGQLSLDIDVETIIKLVDIKGVVVIEVSHNLLQLGPICSCRIVSLPDALEVSPCYLFRVCFSKGLGNCSFEIFPSFVGALSFRDRRFDPCPGISSTLGAHIVDLFLHLHRIYSVRN
jgi:hypothetical protein